MIPILNAEQIRQWDAFTIANEPIVSIDLMERACNAFVTWFVSKYNNQEKVGIVCGTGNNGGDGLGIARLLIEKKFEVKVFVIDGKNQTNDFKTNRTRLPQGSEVSDLTDVVTASTILIDAIFGSGLSRKVEGVYAEVIKQFNASNAVKRS
jgi:ADP-dependent NAD(P)H-hydrate dehydratase / NAD(P)H-hydrate epimerase